MVRQGNSACQNDAQQRNARSQLSYVVSCSEPDFLARSAHPNLNPMKQEISSKFSRRHFAASLASIGALATLRSGALAEDLPVRYPDARIHTLDDKFTRY